jgi:hypothetical protein
MVPTWMFPSCVSDNGSAWARAPLETSGNSVEAVVALQPNRLLTGVPLRVQFIRIGTAKQKGQKQGSRAW